MTEEIDVLIRQVPLKLWRRLGDIAEKHNLNLAAVVIAAMHVYASKIEGTSLLDEMKEYK